MNCFVYIDEFRKKHGYVQKDYPRYKVYVKSAMKQQKEDALRLAMACELNLVKDLMFNSKKFLKKNLRMLKMRDCEFAETYAKYIEALLYPRSIDFLLCLRNKLIDYSTFLDDIDTVLESVSEDFDSSLLCLKYMWNDVELHFTTQQRLENFINKQFVALDSRYDNVLAVKILKVERRKEQLFSLVKSCPSRLRCIYEKVKILESALVDLKNFLLDSFVDSEYVDLFLADTKEFKSFYRKANEFRDCKMDESLFLFQVPLHFSELADEVEKSKESVTIDIPKAKAILMEKAMHKLMCDDSSINLPFLPTFYDIAFDYIKYPSEESRAADMLSKLRLFK